MNRPTREDFEQGFPPLADFIAFDEYAKALEKYADYMEECYQELDLLTHNLQERLKLIEHLEAVINTQEAIIKRLGEIHGEND